MHLRMLRRRHEFQGFALSIAEKIGMIQDVDGSEHFEAGELAVAYQNFMVCWVTDTVLLQKSPSSLNVDILHCLFFNPLASAASATRSTGTVFPAAFLVHSVESSLADSSKAHCRPQSPSPTPACLHLQICVEMLFAAGGMYSGFTYTIYKDPSNTDASAAGGVRKHASITGNLKDTLSPKDLISDTIRNFSSTYKSYAKQGDDDRIVHAGESDEDESDEDDDMEGGDIGTAFGTLKARPHASVVTSTSDSAGLVDNESLA